MKELVKEDLFSAGVQYGREKALWNPKMRDYISALRIDERRNESHIINIELILEAFKNLEHEIRGWIREDKRVLFVGTKKAVVKEKHKIITIQKEVWDGNETKIVERRTRGPIESRRNLFREFCDTLNTLGDPGGVRPKIHFVDRRWIGGTLTNHRVISKQATKLKELDKEIQDPDFRRNNSYIECLQKVRVADKMRKLYSGVIHMRKLPDALFVVDADHEKSAIREAKQLGIKIYATANSHADPSLVDFVIPMNDESPKSLNFLFGYIKGIIKDEIIHIQAENENLSVEEFLEKRAKLENVEVSSNTENEDVVSSDQIKNDLGEV